MLAEAIGLMAWTRCRYIWTLPPCPHVAAEEGPHQALLQDGRPP